MYLYGSTLVRVISYAVLTLGPKRPRKHKDPKNMVSGIPPVLGLGARLRDPCLCDLEARKNRLLFLCTGRASKRSSMHW